MKRVLWIAVGWIACGALWCPMSWAANLYVRSTDGSDADTGATWALAKATLAGALAIATNADTIWVSQAHAEVSSAADITLTCPTTPGLKILDGNDGAEPPTALATTASLSTSSNKSINILGFAYIYGIIFDADENVGASLVLGSTAISHSLVFDTCVFDGGTGSPQIAFGPSATNAGDDVRIDCLGCVFRFDSTGSSIFFRYGNFLIQQATLGTGSAPTTLFSFTAATPSNVLLESSNLSDLAWTNLIAAGITAPSILTVRNCKLPSSITLVTGTRPGHGGPVVKMHNCDSADTHVRIAEDRYEGATISETTVVRTGGASDGTTSLAWKMTASANTQFYAPLESPEIAVWNNTTGASQTVTVEFIHDSLTKLQDDEIWMEAQYYGTSGFPQGTIITDRMTNILSTAANQATSTATWTTTGLTNPNTQAMSVTFTPQEIGYYLIKVMVANPSQVVYVCPKADLT